MSLSLIDVAAAVLKPRLPEVYPGYLAKLVRDALRRHGDPEDVITTIDDIIRIGDGKDLIVATDFNGTQYRITVEVAPAKKPCNEPDFDGHGVALEGAE